MRALLTLAVAATAALAIAPVASGAVAFSHTHYHVGGSPTGIVAGDFDGDGWSDLAATIQDTNRVAVRRTVRVS